MLPLFQGGTIEAQIAYQNAEAQAALANYGKIVLVAFIDVGNALSGEANWRDRGKQLELPLNEQNQYQRNELVPRKTSCPHTASQLIFSPRLISKLDHLGFEGASSKALLYPGGYFCHSIPARPC